MSDPHHDDDPRAHMGLPLPHGKLAMWLFLVTEIMFFTAMIGTYMLIRNGSPPIVRSDVEIKLHLNDTEILTPSRELYETKERGWVESAELRSGETVRGKDIADWTVVKKAEKTGNVVTVQDLWPKPHDVHLVEAIGAGNTFVLIVSSLTIVLAHYYVRKDPKKATLYLGVTLALGTVFMVVKAYEYSQKFKHDIVPGHIGETLPGMDQVEQRKYHGAALKYRERIRSQLQNKTEGLQADMKDMRDSVAADQAQLTKRLEKEPEEKKKAEIDALTQKQEKEILAFVKDYKDPAQRDCYLLLDAMTEKLVGEGNYTRPLSAGELGQRVNQLNKNHEELHLTPTVPHGNMWASFYFAMTGFHALHVLGGLVVIAIFMVMGLRGKLGAQHEVNLEVTGLYWHFVDIVWIFLFPLLYLV